MVWASFRGALDGKVTVSEQHGHASAEKMLTTIRLVLQRYVSSHRAMERLATYN
jgi:hypothetical protein